MVVHGLIFATVNVVLGFDHKHAFRFEDSCGFCNTLRVKVLDVFVCPPLAIYSYYTVTIMEVW